MFPEIHDSLLVGYAADSRRARLVLSLLPHQGSASLAFRIVFSGVAAHHFPYPLLPAVVQGLVPDNANALIARHWASIETGFKENAWPGPWATSLSTAQAFCATQGLKAFELESSYGMSGWVLARSAEVAYGP
jgi:hypothetical protein